jgi:peptidoglycan-N-acetylglucosamine deacetylase
MVATRRLRILQRVREAIHGRVVRALTGVTTDQPVVALTFDDGPDPVFTPRLLDLLAEYDVRATFFMVGVCATRHPQLVGRVAAEGHVIGNHSWDHPSFPLISRRERHEQIRSCEAAIAPYGRRLFRPPYGDLDFASWLEPWCMGYQVVTWTVTSGDYTDRGGDAIADSVVRTLEPGAVVLFHDGLFSALHSGYFRRDATISAVRILFRRLAGRFRFVTIPELLQSGRPRWQHWRRQRRQEYLNQLIPQYGAPKRY